MKPIARSLLAGSFAAPALLAQNSEHHVAFPGGTTIQWKVDEMTDRKRCSLFTPQRGMYVGIYGRDLVSFWTPERRLPAPGRPALVRIDSSAPLSLVVGEKPQLLAVPAAHGRRVVDALYRNSKVVVRYYSFPELEEVTTTVVLGDVAAAYDYATANCGWASTGQARLPLSKEPDIYRADKGYISATIPRGVGWSVTYMPEYQSCSLAADVATTVFSSRSGRPDEVLPLGVVTFTDSSGKVVASLRHDSFAPAPIAEFLKAAQTTGEYGFVRFDRESRTMSLYGLLEAAAFAEATCGVRLR